MRIASAATAGLRHSVVAVVEALVVAAIIAALLLALSPIYKPADFLAGTESAQAAKGGGANKGGGGKPADGGTIALVVLDEDGIANHGDRVTFDIATTATTKPFVALNCYQAGAWIYSKSVGYFPDYPWDQWFQLASTSWPGGAADCTAKLYKTKDGTRTTTLATLSFAVAP